MTTQNELLDWQQAVADAHRAGRLTEAADLFFGRAQVYQPLADRSFDELYRDALLATGTNPIPLRRRIRVANLVQLLLDTPGRGETVAECGCYRGLTSYLMCRTLRVESPAFDGTGYHVFDSFEGLSEPTADDDIPDDWKGADRLRAMSQRGAFAAPLDTVRANLREFPGIAYHPGWIPLSFQKLPERRYRFVHVDVDLYDPTLDCLNYFYPRLVPGGRMVSDDYSWPGARTAIDEFCSEHGIVPALNEHGQAIIACPL